jgi:serine protease Do
MTIAATIERLAEPDSGGSLSSDDDQGGAPRRDGGPRGGQIFGLTLSELDAGLREEFQIEPNVRGLIVLSVAVGGANDGVVKAGDVIETMAYEPTATMTAARAVAGRAAVGEHPIIVRINRDGAITYRRLLARS